jgi:hypothetical protein
MIHESRSTPGSYLDLASNSGNSDVVFLARFPCWLGQGLKHWTRGGEWMGADKNSIQEFSLWTQFHSCTSTSFSCQAHTATGVLLDLGARPNQQPLYTRSGNTHDKAAGTSNQSGRFLKLVRPFLLDLASHRQGKPFRPIWQIGQNTSETQNTSRAFPPLNKRSHSAIETLLL